MDEATGILPLSNDLRDILSFLLFPSKVSNAFKLVQKVVVPVSFASIFLASSTNLCGPRGPDQRLMFPRDVRGRESDRPIDRAMRYIARIPLDLCRCWEGEKEEKGRGRGKNGKGEIKEEKEGKNGRGKEREVVRQRGESMGMGCESECRAGAFKKTEHAGSVER